jgi:CTP synthase
LGITPDVIVLRTSHDINNSMREKIALFCDVRKEAVIQCIDEKILYEVALKFQEQKLDDLVLEHFGLSLPQADMSAWANLIKTIKTLDKSVKIALVGKYVALHDAYLSVSEALRHAGYAHGIKIDIDWINSAEITDENVDERLKDHGGILIPGGFGTRGIAGKIAAIKYARERNIPLFGLCLGMQLSIIEFSRNVLKLPEANSTEFDPDTIYNVIDYLPEQYQGIEMGGTLRLGLYNCDLMTGSLAAKAYGKDKIKERHRHRYEFNNKFKKLLEKQGMIFSGINPETKLCEIIELKDHPWFVATQFHPEFLSRPDRPHPLFKAFVGACIQK